jgi:hypothetical protein
VRDFNDELLAAAGSSWDDFTPFHEAWMQSPQAPEFLARAVELLEEEFGKATLFVLKDPRICRLVPFWTAAIEKYGCVVRPVLTIRNPLEVGNSLQAKKNYTGPFSEMIWLRHALDAEAATRGSRRFHTSFEQLMLGWEDVALRAQESLGIVWPKPVASVEFDVQKFLSRDLRHHNSEPGRVVNNTLLPQWLRATYGILQTWAEKGESEADYPVLDQVKAEFDIASSAFARLIRAERENGLEYKQRIEQLQTAQSAISATAEQRQAALEKSLSDQKAQAEELLASLMAEKAAGVADRETLQSQIAAIGAEAEAQKAELERAVEALQSEIAAAAASAEQEIEFLKSSRQDERRQKTLLSAELQQVTDAREAIEARLHSVQAELAASQERRKEAARVIARRDGEIQKRFEELAALERHILSTSLSWKLRTMLRRALGRKAYS